VLQRLRQRRAEFVLAILLTGLAGAGARSFVFSGFVSIRIDAIGGEVHASDRHINVVVPELSAIRGHDLAVLGVRLRNARSEPRSIALSLHGLPKHRIELPADETVRWDIVLSPGIVRALTATTNAGARRRLVELTSDEDGWALTALEFRNHHLHLGEAVAVVVLPADARAYSPAPSWVSAAVVVSFVALLILFGVAPRGTVLGAASRGLAVMAALTCVGCLILPWVSRYRVLLSPWAFALLAAGLLAPVGVRAIRAAGAPTRRLGRAPRAMANGLKDVSSRSASAINRYWTRHSVTLERGAALAALVALGIAQPIFEVVSNSPEFFAARSTTLATLAAAVIAICLGLPLALLGIERALRRVSPGTAAGFHLLLLMLLSAAVVMPWLRRNGMLPSPWDAAVAAIVGVAVAFAFRRVRTVRQFLTALAPAALVVPAMFFLDPRVARPFLPSESAAGVQAVERTPPIVLVIFDELPLNSLLTADRSIDAGLYPNFAALARAAYWFRNATTVSSDTVWAVPAILSGRYPTARHAVPTLRYYPVNLFTALARHYDIFATLRFQQLCPPRACEYNSAMAPDTTRSLLWDLGLVWLHIVSPESLADALPPVVGDWAEFGRPRAAGPAESRQGRAAVFAEFLSSIDGRPAQLHVIHSILPHMLFQYVPSGRVYAAPDYQTTMEGGKALFERASAAYADTLHQRHLAQVGFVDRLVGDLIARLREVGAYEDALLIITADHGASYREGLPRRLPQEANRSDIIQVPLFIKLPGQRQGAVVDRIVETVDILPTILDVVAADVSLRLDGRSLIDSRAPDRSFRTFIFRDRASVARRVLTESDDDRAASLARKLRRFGSGDPAGLYAVPEARPLLGMRASATLPRARDVEITIRDPEQFAAVARDRDPLPLYVRGVLATSRPDPLNVAVIVNGIVAAVTRSYRERGAHVFGTLVPEASLRDGRNTVEAVVIDAAGGAMTSRAPGVR
jgi:hypothetical protein